MQFQDFLSFANKLPEGMLLISGQGKIYAANRVASQLLETEPEQITKKNIIEFSSSTKEAVIDKLRGGLRSRTLVPVPIKFLSNNFAIKDGFPFTPSTQVSPAQIVIRIEKNHHQITVSPLNQ